MSSPQNPEQLPLTEEQETTYPEFMEQLKCSISGAVISPAGLLPSSAINIGDVIAAHVGQLTALTNSYSYFLVILEMIGCIIDVLCAIPNPFSTISAMIRLFGTCLPNLLLLFPVFTVPAIILCFIKIILSIIEYILETILPIIIDIINNIDKLTTAFQKNNLDAQVAIAFKVAALAKELYNIIGILAALGALFELIKALLNLTLGLPCGGGSDCCNTDNCPDVIKQETLEGTDGRLSLFFTDDFNYDIKFSSSSRQDEFLSIRNFVPRGINYNDIDRENIPYIIRVSGQDYILNYIDENGTLDLISTPNDFLEDGYLSNKVTTLDIFGTIVETTINDPDIRFATQTPTFDSSFTSSFNPSSFFNRRFIELQELRDPDINPDSLENNGTFEINSTVLSISSVLDEYNVILTRTDGDSWDGYSVLNPDSHIRWRLLSAFPQTGSNKSFNLQINHEELIRRQMIGYGCHPAISAEGDALRERFPDFENQTLPAIPDLDALINTLNSNLAVCFPIDVDSQYILDNYDSIANCITGLESDISNSLNSFSNELIDYAGGIYPRLFDPEGSLLSAAPLIQKVGEIIRVSATPLNRSGSALAADLPAGVIDVNINVSGGTISEPVEILDAYGITTGEFRAELTSNIPIIINITADVAGRNFSDFDGSTLVDRVVTVEFVDEVDFSTTVSGEVSQKPLGS